MNSTHADRRVAVIGAGLSGLVAARRLASSDVPVTVFDKGRGVGGRMSTRRAPHGMRFDHGAQYFTVRDGRFRTVVNDWLDDGVAAPWLGRIAVIEQGRLHTSPILRDRFVGVPGMNAICKRLAEGLDVRVDVRVAPVRRAGDRWQLSDDAGQELGEFTQVLSTAPAPQTAELLAAAPKIAAVAAGVAMHKCWAVMVEFDAPLTVFFDAAFVNSGPLSWIARDTSKPGRIAQDGGESWVLHGSHDWSAEHIDDAPEQVVEQLLATFFAEIRVAPQPARYSAAHRWLYTGPVEPCAERFLRDDALCAFAAGDWCGGPRVEGAFLSGLAAAEAMLGLC